MAMMHYGNDKKAIQATFSCYIDRVPALMANPKSEYILRDKATNKEIEGWNYGWPLGQPQAMQAQVFQDPKAMQQYHDFLKATAEDKRTGAAMMDRKNTKTYVKVTGIIAIAHDDSKKDKFILLNPKYELVE